MSKFIALLLFGAGLVLAGCASSTQEASVLQLPGTATRSGLEVPPDVGERPVQTAAALERR